MEPQVKERADLVVFSGPADPEKPVNWPLKKKILTTALYGFTTMGATLATAMYVHLPFIFLFFLGVADSPIQLCRAMTDLPDFQHLPSFSSHTGRVWTKRNSRDACS